MGTVEFRGGPITHRYLMNKTKEELARFYMDLLRRADVAAKAMREAAAQFDDYGDQHQAKLTGVLSEAELVVVQKVQRNRDWATKLRDDAMQLAGPEEG